MDLSKTDSWKSKIDPAFNSMIKTYVKELLEPFGKLPKGGRLTLNDELSELVLNSSGWHSSYIEDKPKDEVIGFLRTIGMVDDPLLKVFVYPGENKKEYFDNCLKIAESLPGKSKAYYTQQLNLLMGSPEIIPPFNLFEMPKSKHKDVKEFYSVINSMLMRRLFIVMSETAEQAATQEEMEAFKQPEIINSFIGFLSQTLSQIAFQRPLRNLLIRFRDGDDDSLYKALRLDKTLLYCVEVKERIIKAQTYGDVEFFKKLGKSISSGPLQDVNCPEILFPVLFFFWPMGLYRLSRKELYDLLVSSDIISMHHSFDALEKFLQRYILPYNKD